jgi:hypothetical protein
METLEYPAILARHLHQPAQIRLLFQVPQHKRDGKDSEEEVIAKMMAGAAPRFTSAGYQRDMHRPLAWAIKLDQHHRLPRAEHQLSGRHRHRQGRSQN